MRPASVKIFTLLLSIYCVFCVAASPAFAEEAAGTVTSATRAFVFKPDMSKPKPLKVKDKIYAGDTIGTDPKKGGSLRVLMRDGTTVSLGSTSAFRIQTYTADGATPSFTGMMFVGIVRLITGKIAKINPEGTVIQTPHATVGIRGTDCVLHCIPVYFRNESGSGYMSEATEVFVLHSAQPVLLNGTPIESGQKGKVSGHGGDPELGVVTPEERRKFNRLVPASHGADTSDIDKSITTENP